MLITYRMFFDRLINSQINWTPYTSHIMTLLPHQCHSGQAMWTYVGPMICFHLVEKHQADRVLRQFHMLQMPPEFCSTDQGLHQIDLRGKHDQDWSRIHAEHIAMCHSRNNFCVEVEATQKPTVSDNYFSWYTSITRHFMTPDGAYYYRMNNFVEDVHRVSMENNFEIFRPMCDEVMGDIDRLGQRIRRLNVVDTDRRRIRRRRRRQGDDVVEGDGEDS
ncbi:serine/threonine-protein phosphatase 7 long form homolog [Cucumis sativus]|uniref:serine/threonine-protein phosphatase 7 long form homolog n=1 Tax=Cucumis sativus TaxID=3659 RepID=UPI0012F4823C|nr:serine/threonine-protein phosphatase 7 long form homolog [Cucumis sativus]